MRTRYLLLAALWAGAMLSASSAQAVDIIFTGRVTSDVDNGALFGLVGTSLVGQAITIDFGFAPVASGATGVDASSAPPSPWEVIASMFPTTTILPGPNSSAALQMD
jgi:hypothetical protein